MPAVLDLDLVDVRLHPRRHRVELPDACPGCGVALTSPADGALDVVSFAECVTPSHVQGADVEGDGYTDHSGPYHSTQVACAGCGHVFAAATVERVAEAATGPDLEARRLRLAPVRALRKRAADAGDRAAWRYADFYLSSVEEPVCAAEENGMRRCSLEDAARGVACGGCMVPPRCTGAWREDPDATPLNAVVQHTADFCPVHEDD